MIYFRSDYSLGGHPRMLKTLEETNMVHTDGYSLDVFCDEARRLIQKEIGIFDADVHFIPGGTPCNLIAISSFLRPHQAAIAPATGHICVHETGAIEATGHKIIHVPSTDGKFHPEEMAEIIAYHEDEHMVLPKLLYISDTTEIGTVYTKAELQAIRKVCDQYGIYVYLDGARLAMALTSQANDLTMADIAELTDAFYIGGTKNGGLFGEAIVISNPDLKEDFRYLIKQKGGMFAKGRLIGAQFIEFFKYGLYYELGQNANKLAKQLSDGIKEKGYEMYIDSPSNQIFPIFPNEQIEKLENDFFFYIWRDLGNGKSAIRLVTSWGSSQDDVDAFLSAI
ncbi:MAG: threonine aldolase family protein [Anaerovoracaceae bacterium]